MRILFLRCAALAIFGMIARGAAAAPDAAIAGSPVNVSASAPSAGASTQPASPDGYETRQIEGWTVHINKKLLAGEDAPAITKALQLLSGQLKQIPTVVPAKAVEKLRTVRLWLNPPYPGIAGTAEYHPDAGWLREHGRNPKMARCVEITDIKNFEAESHRMPWFVLHELSHAYHDQVLGFDDPRIIAAYKKAVESKAYDAVERFNGDGRENTIERAYAMTNEREYFAESTEAFFGRNDFYPFTREQLRKVDPTMHDLLAKVWGVDLKN